MASRSRVVVLISWLAFLILFSIAAIVPIGYFFTASGAFSASVATEAEIGARLLTDIVNANPTMWEYEQSRIEGILSQRSAQRDPEARKVYNLRGEQIASNLDALPPPIVTRSADLHDSGIVVGHIEVSRSLEPILVRTSMLALGMIALACSAYVIVRVWPIRLIATREEELRRSEEKYRSLIETSTDAIIVFDKATDLVLEINHSALTMLDITRERAIGMPHAAIYPADEAESYRELVIRCSEGATTRVDGLSLCSTRGARLDVDVSANITVLGGREVVQCRFRDMTEHNQIEKKLLRAERMAALGTLTAGIAHQFNNIHTIALANLHLLETTPDKSASSRQYVASTRKAIDRAVSITSQLELFSNPATAALPPVLAGDVVREVLSSLRPQIDHEEVALSVDLRDTRPVRVGQAQLEFIVRSLLVNAQHALLDSPRRELRVETTGHGDWTCIRVEDTGIGIAAEKRGRLFTPFFSEKGENAPPGSPQARVKGVGLSLAVSHSIVTSYGGRIQVESAAGAGATFSVWLPTMVMAHE